MAFTGKNARPINSPSQKIIKGRFPIMYGRCCNFYYYFKTIIIKKIIKSNRATFVKITQAQALFVELHHRFCLK